MSTGPGTPRSGRAGRRGKDDRGLTIICLDQKVEPDAAKELFLGKAHKLDSAFHLGYNMLCAAQQRRESRKGRLRIFKKRGV